MKWGGFKVQSWDDAWKAVLSIAIVIIIVFMLVDFISWRTALDIIKKEMPAQGIYQPSIFIRGIGYIPFVWRGNFKQFYYHSNYEDQIEKPYLIGFQLGNHELFYIYPNGSNWSDYHSKNEKLREQGIENDWQYQEFEDAIIYVKITSTKFYEKDYKKYCDIKILVFMETEEKHYFRTFNLTLERFNCGGGYWSGVWKK
jgi:hypothetical protein